jgi:cytidyltransferase-like protein
MHKIIVLSGGFDPVHEGHIAMFQAAAENYDEVIVGLNSQEWLARKKGKAFMSDQTRAAVLNAIGCIDSVRFFDDSDNSCIELLREVRS